MKTITPRQNEILEIAQKLRDYYGFPATVDEIAAQLGITKQAVYSSLKALRAKGSSQLGTAKGKDVEGAISMRELSERYSVYCFLSPSAWSEHEARMAKEGFQVIAKYKNHWLLGVPRDS